MATAAAVTAASVVAAATTVVTDSESEVAANEYAKTVLMTIVAILWVVMCITAVIVCETHKRHGSSNYACGNGNQQVSGGRSQYSINYAYGNGNKQVNDGGSQYSINYAYGDGSQYPATKMKPDSVTPDCTKAIDVKAASSDKYR